MNVHFQDILTYQNTFLSMIDKLYTTWEKNVPNSIMLFFVKGFSEKLSEMLREELLKEEYASAITDECRKEDKKQKLCLLYTKLVEEVKVLEDIKPYLSV